jgi:LDH2 family malate/lactate/ureidoglycolate dehydrogenase
VNSLKVFVRRVAVKAGLEEIDAMRFAEVLVSADLQGNATHGISRLAIYVRRMQRGLIEPRAALTVRRQHGGVLALDANNGLGQVQALKALDLLRPLARVHGVASATICNSQHFGTLSYYCNLMAEENLILLAMTNCEPAMSPEGGCEAYFGTNPIGASFPTDKGFSVKVDLATSIVARGNIIAADKAGKPIPAGWALNAAGEPTTDPKEALNGTVLTMAGHKGYAMAVMVEAFSSVLAGAAIGSSIGSMYKQMDRPQGVGHFFCLFDISAFMPVAQFNQRMGQMVDGIKACRRRPGTDEILVPGERSTRLARQNAGKGVPVGKAVLDELIALGTEFGVTPDFTRVS